MIRLRVREHVPPGMSPGQLQTRLTILLGESVYLATVRRYWYGTSDGKPEGPPIKMIDLHMLGAIASVLGVRACDLLDESQSPGQWAPQLMAA